MYIYKESELLNELPTCDANYIRNADVNINTDVVELTNQLELLANQKGIDVENKKIIESIISAINTIDVSKYCRIVFVEDDMNDKIYYCTSDINSFQLGNEVAVKFKNEEIEGLVREVAYYSKTNLPVDYNELYTITEILYK